MSAQIITTRPTTKSKDFHCPKCSHTITSTEIASFMAKRIGAGRKPTLKECEYCGHEFGVAAMRLHIPLCASNPNRDLGGGADKVLRVCEFCDKEFGSNALIYHRPRCPKNQYSTRSGVLKPRNGKVTRRAK